jgi:hypothetical protein
VRVFGNRGDGIFAEGTSYSAGLGVTSIALAELDGYAGLEVVALDTTDAVLLVFPGYASPRAEPWTFRTQEWPWIVVTSDFDSDGVSDLAIVSGEVQSGLSVLTTRCAESSN